ERLRRAKVINAMGEQQAAEKLVEAGRTLAREPQAMQLRYFAALHDIAGERYSTVVFPMPMDLLGHLPRRPNEATRLVAGNKPVAWCRRRDQRWDALSILRGS